MRGSNRLVGALVAVGLLAVLAFPGCGGGNGGGGGGGATSIVATAETEANNTFGTANALSATGAGSGDVAVIGDVDYWSFSAVVNQTIRVELHALRRQLATWDFNNNRPRLTLFDVDGTTKLLEHDFTMEAWPSGAADLDFPAFHIPATGTYFLRVGQDNAALPGGAYVLVVKSITLPVPFQNEAEPFTVTGVNDTPLTAQAIVPGTVHAWHVDNESDYFSFNISSPSTVCFETLGFRNGLSRGDTGLFDSRLTLYGPGPVLLLSLDDVALRDSILCWKILTPGTYFIQVDDGFSTGDGEYFLFYERVAAPLGATETEPNDTAGTADTTNYDATSRGITSIADPDFYKFFGTAGDAVIAHYFDAANAEGSVATITLVLLAPDGVTVLNTITGPTLQVARTILQVSGDHYVRVLGNGAATNYCFRLQRIFGSGRESEPNNTVVSADGFPAGNRISGVIGAPGDLDHFSFGAVAGEVITVHLYGGPGLHPWSDDDFDRFGSILQGQLTLFDPAAAIVAASTRTPTFNLASAQGLTEGLASLSVTFHAATAGNYTVLVADENANGGGNYHYLVERR